MTTTPLNVTATNSSSVFSLFENTLKEMVLSTVKTIPKILISVFIVVIALVSIKYINKLITFVIQRTKFEEFLHKYTGANIPITKILILVTDIGIALVAVAGILNVVAPDLIPVYKQGLDYFARLVSVVFLSLVSILGLNTIISFIRLEEKIKSFVVLIVFLLIFAFLVDLTALSTAVKAAIVNGISVGVGIAIGAFAIWFLFGEYIERVLESRERREREK